MAFLGAIGKTLGLGSTGQVIGNVLGGGLGQAFNNPSQPAVTTAPTNIQNTVELSTSGEEGYRTVGQGAFSQANLLPAVGRGLTDRTRDIIIGLGGGEILGQAFDAFGGGNNVCMPKNSMQPYSVNKQTGCISVSRKQQARLKQMVGIVGLSATADAIGLSEDNLVMLLLKRFRARGRGITAASMRTTKRTIRQIKNLHNEVSSMAGRRTPVRRTAAVKQVKYSN